MLKNRFYGFIFLSLLLWTVVTYYLFLHQPQGTRIEIHTFDKESRQLESKIKALQKSNSHLLNLVKILLKSTENPLEIKDEILEQNEKELEEERKKNEEDFIVSIRTIAERRLPDGGPVIPVLVFACNRVTVEKCLNQLIMFRPSRDQFPIIVSQDCQHGPTSQVIANYADEVIAIHQPNQEDILTPPKEKKFKGYYKIARHYGWALNQTLVTFHFKQVIIVEDDLDISADFFEYFLGTFSLLKRDPTLWCISAWNDNGKENLVDEKSPDLLYRTDFFPGLGWMLTQDLWAELAPKWPASYWDDWIRQPEQRKNRACIRPELSRTKTFGKVGVSNGFFYDKHLKYIKLNTIFVPFTQKNLTYLLKDNYDVQFVKQVYESPVVTYQELRSGTLTVEGPVRIQYHTIEAYKRTARILGLMEDFRSGVPRTGYRGVVSFIYKGRRVYLAPNANWKGYNPKWS